MESDGRILRGTEVRKKNMGRSIIESIAISPAARDLIPPTPCSFPVLPHALSGLKNTNGK